MQDGSTFEGTAGSEGSTGRAYETAIKLALAHFGAGRWLEARRAFEHAHALRPSARTSRGIAFASYYLGDYPSAAHAFQRSIRDERHPLTAQQRRECEDYLARAQTHIGRLRLSVEPAEARLFLDDRPLPVQGSPVYLHPGSHHLRVELSGYEAVLKEFDLASGDQLSLHVMLRPLRPTQPSRPRSSQAPAAVQLRKPVATTGVGGMRSPPVTIAGGGALPWLTAGATLGLGLATGAFGMLAVDGFESVKADCQRFGCDPTARARLWKDANVDTYKTLFTVSLVGTGLALATTITLFALRGGGEDGSTTALRVTPRTAQVLLAF